MDDRLASVTPSTEALEREIEKYRFGAATRRRIIGGAAALLGIGAGTAVASAGAATPSMTAGPFYPSGGDIPAHTDPDLVRKAPGDPPATGQLIYLNGRVLSLAGEAIAGARVEIWQADAKGRYHHSRDRRDVPRDDRFQGAGVLNTSAGGAFQFRTIKPAPYPLGGGSVRTPHIHMKVEAPGHDTLITQLFFEGEALNGADVLLSRIPRTQHSAIVIAYRSSDDVEAGSRSGSIDIVLG